MTDSTRILDRYTNQRPGSTPAASEPADLEPLDLGSFGYLRGIRDRAVMLELRKKNGNVRAIGYAWISEVEYDPSVGITLHFGGQKIKIIGRNLNSESNPSIRLLDGIIRQRVTFIQESGDSVLALAAESDTVVEHFD